MIEVIQALYDLVGSNDWVSYSTYPERYKGKVNQPPFLRISVLEGDVSRVAYSNSNKKKLDGLIIVQIITKSGEGQVQPATIASELDVILEDKSLTPTISTELSSFNTIGSDPDDSTLLMSQYSVPFTVYKG